MPQSITHYLVVNKSSAELTINEKKKYYIIILAITNYDHDFLDRFRY